MNFKMHLLLFTSFLLFSLNGYSQKGNPVVMTVNGEGVTKSEFLQVYLKNNESPKYDKESLDEYMELYKKFKLKVAEAEALGYDTIDRKSTRLNSSHVRISYAVFCLKKKKKKKSINTI